MRWKIDCNEDILTVVLTFDVFDVFCFSDKGTVRDFRFTAQTLDSVKSSVANALEESPNRSVSCLDLMLSEEQLKLEGYPLPLVNSRTL